MMKCMCKCPKLLELDKNPKLMCEDKAGTIDCVTSTTECEAMAAQMKPKQVDLHCEYLDKGCDKKEKDMMTCVGAEDMTTWTTKGCDDGATIKMEADTCCPIGKKLVDCMTTECLTISMALDKMSEKGEDQDMKHSRDACPDAGIPSEAAVDSAAPGQTVGMLAMTAALAAYLIA